MSNTEITVKALKKRGTDGEERSASNDYKAEHQFQAYSKHLISICRLITWTVERSKNFKYVYYNTHHLSNFVYFCSIQRSSLYLESRL